MTGDLARGSGSGTDGVEIGYGRAWVRANGWPMAVVLALLVVWSALAWWMARNFDGLAAAAAAVTQEHRGLRDELRTQTCILSMTTEEKVHMRAEFARLPSGSVRAALITYCPWLAYSEGPP